MSVVLSLWRQSVIQDADQLKICHVCYNQKHCTRIFAPEFLPGNHMKLTLIGQMRLIKVQRSDVQNINASTSG